MAIQTNKDVTEITYNGVNIPLYHKTQTKSTTITSNGTTTITKDADYDGMTSVEITTNVPAPAPSLQDITITENGTYTHAGYDGYDEVNVNVPTTTIEALSVTENGTYTAPSGTAYSPVTVNVSGGSSVDESKDILFIDYDGTPLYSYTQAEALALTSMPSNPSHNGLTAQGWNWTLSELQTFCTDYPNGVAVIGQTYTTSDGKTRIYINAAENSFNFTFGIYLNGTATINWGDGGSDTLTGTSITSRKTKAHTYTNAGDYVITITVTGSFHLGNRALDTSKYNLFNMFKKFELGDGYYNTGTYSYNNMLELESVSMPYSANTYNIEGNFLSLNAKLKGIVFPRNTASITTNGIHDCMALKYISFPYSMTVSANNPFPNNYYLEKLYLPVNNTSFGTNLCQNDGLKKVAIPNGLTAIPNRFCYLAQRLAEVEIPSGVTSIDQYAFASCTSLNKIVFKPTAPPTVSNSNAFASLSKSCIIYVPSGSLSAYTSATNYPASNNYKYVEF